MCKSLLLFILIMTVSYLVPFLRHSASKNGVTLKSALRVVQGH